MAAWREKLARLVSLAPTLRPPGEGFQIRPRSGIDWPTELPPGPTLPEFYEVCDGGRFPAGRGHVEILPLDHIGSRTHEVAMRLASDLEEQGREPSFVAGRHVVFGWNTDEVNLIWDAVTDRVIGHMPFDDHDWVTEPPLPLPEYLEELLSASPDRLVLGSALSEWWFNLLAEVDSEA